MGQSDRRVDDNQAPSQASRRLALKGQPLLLCFSDFPKFFETEPFGLTATFRLARERMQSVPRVAFVVREFLRRFARFVWLLLRDQRDAGLGCHYFHRAERSYIQAHP